MKVMLDPNLPRHHKVRKLAKSLNVTPQAALGLLVCLWCEAMQQRESGSLTGWDDCDVAVASGWMGDHDLFIKAMLSARWLDKDGDTYQLHDWIENQGELLHKREQWRASKRKQRVCPTEKKDIPQDKLDSPKDKLDTVQQISECPASPFPSLSLPIPSLPIQSTDSPKPKPAATQQRASAMNGTIEATIVTAWNNGPGFPINHPQGQRLVRNFIDSGVSAQKCHEAVMNQPACKGKKIWEVLEPLRPAQSPPGVKSISEILSDFAKTGGK